MSGKELTQPGAGSNEAARPRLLVVDDEGQVRAAALESLRGLGHIDVACDCREALAYLARWPYAVVVADKQMPWHTGVWLLSQVMRLWPRTGRVLVTTDPRDDPRPLQELGVAHSLVYKPVFPAQLRAVVDELVTRRSDGQYIQRAHRSDPNNP